MVDPISKAILDEIHKYARQEKEREIKLPYWLHCPCLWEKSGKKRAPE